MGKTVKTAVVGAPPAHRAMVPEIQVPVMAQLQPRGDGSFTLRPRLPDAHGETWIKTTEAVRVSGQSDSTLYRWAEVGLVKIRRPTPTKWEWELGSLTRHLEAIKDPEFWERHRQAGEFLKTCRR